MRFSLLRLTFLSYVLLITVITCVFFRPIFIYLIFNKTNLENSKAISIPRLANAPSYRYLLAQLPDNPQIRWHLGIFLAKTGQLDEAVDTLLPLLLSQSNDQTLLRSVLSMIVRADRSDDALYAYDAISRNSALLPQFTAYVALQYLNRDHKLPGDLHDSMKMLLDALGFSYNSPDYDILLTHLQSKDFWLSLNGKRLKRVLQWKTQVSDLFPPDPQRRVIVSSKAQSELQDLLASVLHIPQSLIRLGPELSTNSTFENREICSNARSALYCCCSAGWSLSYMSSGNVWNRGMFFIGLDNKHSLSEHHALRIDGVIIDRKADLELARAGVWHPMLKIDPDSSYVISFFYQTNDVSSDAFAIYLTTVPTTFSPIEKYYPPSPNRWKRVVAILPNHRSQFVTFQPLLRLWSEGTVWIDDFSIRKIDFQKDIFVPEIIYYNK